MITLAPNVLCYTIIDGKPAKLVRIEHQVHTTRAFECRDEETGALYTYFPQNLMPVNTTPSRYSRHMFVGMAPIIGAALNAYPDCIEATPGGLSIETFARRVREARDAKIRYPQYKHSEIDDLKFERFGSLLRTKMIESPSGFKLRIGPKESLGGVPKAAGIGIFQPLANEICVDASNLENLERLLRLMNDRVFSPVPVFTVTNLTPAQIEELESRYDIGFIAFEAEPNKFQIL